MEMRSVSLLMKTKLKPPVLTVTFNWSGELPKKVSGELKKQWLALLKPRTFKFKLPR